MATAPTLESKRRVRTIALVGNPNTGKTTLFNALTGFRQRVANYPGTTVERKTGMVRCSRGEAHLQSVDLPGAYSLNARSGEEAVVLDVLLGRDSSTPRPEAVVCVADATHLSRSLFLASQLTDLGVPIVIALNMVDIARARGLTIDHEALTRELGMTVVPVVATKHTGIEELTEAIVRSLDSPPAYAGPRLPVCVTDELDGLSRTIDALDHGAASSRVGLSRVELTQSLLDPGGYHEAELLRRWGGPLADDLSKRRKRIADSGESLLEIEAQVRYAWIEDILSRVVRRAPLTKANWSDRVDRILTHRVAGFIVLVAVMAVCFQAIYSWAGPIMGAIDGAFSALAGWVGQHMPAGALQSLVTNGAIAGVGAVLAFLPQILILFLFLAILEDCGYMARAAFLLDRVLGRIGLNGKSFIPLLSSFACAVPGILATRTIEDRRARFVTILIAPLMSCSARLPVYTLMIAAFIPSRPVLGGVIGLQAVVLLAMYLVGVSVAIPVAVLLQKTLLRGEAPSFLLELPSFKLPGPRTVLYKMYEQGREFCKSAGTIIFAVAIVVWALGYFPHPASIGEQHDVMRAEAVAAGVDSEALAARLEEIGRAEAGAYLRQSLLGRMGEWIEPAVRPLGWDWRIGTAVIAAFPAREVVIATMGTIYNLGADQDEASVGLREKLRSATWPDGRAMFTVPVALSIMVFFALCCQCGATLATIKRETNSWRWPLLTFGYMTVLAYVGAWVTYRVAVYLA